jgi:N-methylhydantoinase A
VPRELIRGVTERLAADGSTLQALDEDELLETVRHLREEDGVASLAVLFLHSYRNPAHERRARALINQAYPDLDVTISSDISPEFREYERASTTVINAYVRPLVRRYVDNLARELSGLGYRRRLMIMQSNGGVLPAEVAAEQPVRMILSGPAAGVTGAVHLAKAGSHRNLITMDIGGTSCDVSLISDAVPEMVSKGLSEYRIDGHPINIRMMDIATIGAGGGSIAWIDDGGMLRVGPESAGSKPGPACYGRGGTQFTVTDALVLMGFIDPDRFIGGEMQIHAGLSSQAARPLCDALGVSEIELARNVYRLTVNNIAQQMRQVTVQRGKDPRGYAVLPYGGGGALFAAVVAEEIGADHVVVPRLPGVFSAYGLTTAQMRLDVIKSAPGTRLSSISSAIIEAEFARLEADVRQHYASFGVDPSAVAVWRHADARYVGQGFELTVPISGSDDLARAVADGFNQAHADRYGHSFPEQELEIVSYRVDGVADLGPRAERPFVANPQAPPKGTSSPAPGGETFTTYDREGLPEGSALAGPCLVYEATSAVFVPPGWSLTVDSRGDLILARSAAGAAMQEQGQ